MARGSLWWMAYAAWCYGSFRIARTMNDRVGEPYMDEIFHAPQAQAYCRGDWRYWDPALTTPPGLYLVPAALAHLQQFVPLLRKLGDPCSLAALRGLNLVLSVSLPFLYSSLLRLLRPRPVSKGHLSEAVNDWEGLFMALFPMLGWWAWMYYTDLASVVAVLLSWRFALERQHTLSALLGAVSLWFRQTNIVWVAFIAAQTLIARLEAPSTEDAPRRALDPLLREAALADMVRVPLQLVLFALRNLPALVPVVATYLPVCLGAVAFVRWNGGIVLGDKTNHVPAVHLAQALYFVAFAGVFFAPLVATPSRLREAITGLVRTPSRVVGSALGLIGVVLIIKTFTIAHPFLLADNRHYAFYLWRRVINVHPLARYVLVPGYLVAGRLLWLQLARASRMTLSTLVLFVGATCAVLAPTPLLEPRYFLTPLVILRLYLSPGAGPLRPRSLAAEALLYLAIQAACVWLFLERPFLWDIQIGADGRGLEGRDERELGRLQRFMW
ncbi:hypothetical protein BMF94_3835 [Rhodotorula taiwanensis]|uniref:Dol-P-Glc:Glc(2)Man(9)GlcNAc(2)-PP-Dol alpha-1,2-glucosyltransferase n=1 Tax=Rhodotorula taiwanensis TaxID=741276 RepID=A0A2S5B8N8_9BASI|nr:hypothetical protein BMF94_3835 [Rhodotorula taiwanensis]